MPCLFFEKSTEYKYPSDGFEILSILQFSRDVVFLGISTQKWQLLRISHFERFLIKNDL